MHSKTQTKWIISEFSCWCFSSPSSFLCWKVLQVAQGHTHTISVLVSLYIQQMLWIRMEFSWTHLVAGPASRHALVFRDGILTCPSPSSLCIRRRSGNRLIARSKQCYEKELVFGLAALCCRVPFVATSVVHGWFVDPCWVQCWWNALEANFFQDHHIVPSEQLLERDFFIQQKCTGRWNWVFFLPLFYNRVSSFMSVVLLLGGTRWKWNFHLTTY